MRDEDALKRLREICLALPGTSEQGGVGDPTFKVRDKIFAMRHRVEWRIVNVVLGIRFDKIVPSHV